MQELDVSSQLKLLIETCDAAEGAFVSCASNANRMDLQLMMTQRAAAWRLWAAELRSLPDSPASVLHSTPLVDAGLQVYSDMNLLAECERVEEAAVRRYRDVLEQDLPPVARAVIQRHVDSIQRSRANMRSLRAGTEHASV
jgi:hypothetical protein